MLSGTTYELLHLLLHRFTLRGDREQSIGAAVVSAGESSAASLSITIGVDFAGTRPVARLCGVWRCTVSLGLDASHGSGALAGAGVERERAGAFAGDGGPVGEHSQGGAQRTDLRLCGLCDGVRVRGAGALGVELSGRADALSDGGRGAQRRGDGRARGAPRAHGIGPRRARRDSLR